MDLRRSSLLDRVWNKILYFSSSQDERVYRKIDGWKENDFTAFIHPGIKIRKHMCCIITECNLGDIYISLAVLLFLESSQFAWKLQISPLHLGIHIANW